MFDFVTQTLPPILTDPRLKVRMPAPFLRLEIEGTLLIGFVFFDRGFAMRILTGKAISWNEVTFDEDGNSVGGVDGYLINPNHESLFDRLKAASIWMREPYLDADEEDE